MPEKPVLPYLVYTDSQRKRWGVCPKCGDRANIINCYDIGISILQCQSSKEHDIRGYLVTGFQPE